MIEKGARTPVEKPGPSETLREPQRDMETSRDTWRHLETPRHTWGDHQPEKHTLLIMFFFCFLYMFTEWTKFNKLNMILQPCIPTLKVPFFWSMFSLLKQLKTRKEKLYILIKVRTYLHVWSSVYRLLWQLVCSLQGWKFAPPHGGATSIGYNQEI